MCWRVNPCGVIVTSDKKFEAAREGEQKKRAKDAAKEAPKVKGEAKATGKKTAPQKLINADTDSNEVDDDIELAQLLYDDINSSKNESADEDDLRPSDIVQLVLLSKNDSDGYKYKYVKCLDRNKPC